MESLKHICVKCMREPLWIQLNDVDIRNPYIPEEMYKRIMKYRCDKFKINCEEIKCIDEISEEEYRYRGKIIFEYSHYICNISNIYDESYDRVKVKYEGEGIYKIDMKWEQRCDYYGKYIHSRGIWNRKENKIWIEHVVDKYEYEKLFKISPGTYISNIMKSNR